MHLERGRVNQKTRTDKAIMHAMIAEDVADILAKETFDAFAKFLDAIDVALLHPPGAVGSVGWARFERLDPFFDRVIPRDIGNQILQPREGFHRLDRDRAIERKIAQAR